MERILGAPKTERMRDKIPIGMVRGSRVIEVA